MQIQEARSLVMMALKRGGGNQLNSIIDVAGRIRGERAGEKRQYVSSGREYLKRGDETILMEAIWGLIIQGVLVPGKDDNNPNFPFVRLTDYGRKCIEADRLLPHDPDGFLVQFQREVPSADPVIVEYLTESLQCFLRGLNRAAAVMLGGASEKVVLLMFDALGSAISVQTRKKKYDLEMDKATSIFKKYEVFERRFAPVLPTLPKELRDNLDSLVRGVFDLIRSSRNDAGHPSSGILIDRDTVYSHLRLFVPYCKRIYALIDWFSTNPI